MKLLAAALTILAGAFVALPAAAQTEITVFGGVDPFITFPRPIYNDDYVYGRNLDPNWPFDPAAAAINALNISNLHLPRGRSPLNLARALTLNATGESLAEHQLRCQDRFASYDLVSDTYYGENGIPRPCQ